MPPFPNIVSFMSTVSLIMFTDLAMIWERVSIRYGDGNAVCFVIVLSIDAMDVSGESQIDVISNILKQRLHLDGTLIDAEAELHGNITSDRA